MPAVARQSEQLHRKLQGLALSLRLPDCSIRSEALSFSWNERVNQQREVATQAFCAVYQFVERTMPCVSRNPAIPRRSLDQYNGIG